MNYSYVIIGDQEGNTGIDTINWNIPTLNVETDEPNTPPPLSPSERKKLPGLILGTKERLETVIVAVIGNEESIILTKASFHACTFWHICNI